MAVGGPLRGIVAEVRYQEVNPRPRRAAGLFHSCRNHSGDVAPERHANGIPCPVADALAPTACYPNKRAASNEMLPHV